jgi:hypothetical protein
VEGGVSDGASAVTLQEIQRRKRGNGRRRRRPERVVVTVRRHGSGRKRGLPIYGLPYLVIFVHIGLYCNFPPELPPLLVPQTHRPLVPPAVPRPPPPDARRHHPRLLLILSRNHLPHICRVLRVHLLPPQHTHWHHPSHR